MLAAIVGLTKEMILTHGECERWSISLGLSEAWVEEEKSSFRFHG